MNREELNRIRRMGGVAQDFSAETLEEAGLGQYSGMGATTSGPDNHVHPKVSDSELDYEGDYKSGDEENGDAENGDEHEDVSFTKGDKVMYHDEDFVVVLAGEDSVVIAPAGQESDMEAIKIVGVGELQGSDDEGSDEDMDSASDEDMDDSPSDEDLSDEDAISVEDRDEYIDEAGPRASMSPGYFSKSAEAGKSKVCAECKKRRPKGDFKMKNKKEMCVKCAEEDNVRDWSR